MKSHISAHLGLPYNFQTQILIFIHIFTMGAIVTSPEKSWKLCSDWLILDMIMTLL